jgi:alpha-L-rhamnosidase
MVLALAWASAGLPPLATATPATATAAPVNLTVEHLPEPVDVEDLTAPLLGWQVGSGMQSAYEVQVATTSHGVSHPDVWDSGKVASTENANVPYAGPALSASDGYYWRVRTWSPSGRASRWSHVSHFGTGPGRTWPGATPIWTTNVPGLSVADFTYTGTFTIGATAASINFREHDTGNFYMWQFRTDGTLKEHKDVDGSFTVLNIATLPLTPVAGTPYDFKITTSGTTISTWIKASSSDTWLSAGSLTDSTFAAGGVGFRTGSTESFTADNLVLTDSSGTVRYSNDFGNAANTDFSGCGSVTNGALSVGSSKNCTYVGSGTGNDNWAFLRGDVTLHAGPIAWAHLYVAASSTVPARQFVAKTSVNGSVVGVGPSRPVGSETRYDGYDVAALLRPGAVNTISALAYTTSDQRYQAQLIVRYANRTTQTFSTGPAWKALNGYFALPDGGSIGTSYYTAPKENFQAAKYPFGYDTPRFDDSSWPAATPRPAFTDLVATPVAKVRQVLETPTKVVEYSPGNYFIDYGRTWIGGVSLDLTGTAGQVVDIRYGQVTSSTDTVKYATSAGNDYEDRWTLRAGPNPLQTWGPRVFRYVNVLNAPTGLGRSDFRADAYIYPFDTGLNQFDSASTNLDQVWQLSKNTIQSLNLNGFVDSYERERGFYEADDYIQQMSNLYTGGDPTLGTYSTLYLVANRTWPTEWPFYVILSLHDTYLASGDISTLAQAYTALQGKLPDKWYDPATGLIHKTTGTSCSSSTDCDIVDWPAGDRDGYQFSGYNTVVNAISYRAYADMADIATALGRTADAATYTAKATSIRNALNTIMWDPAKGAYSDGSTDGSTRIAHWAVQASAFAVAMGVATPDRAAAAATYLDTRGMACSVYCADFMLQAAYTGDNAAVGDGFLTSTSAHSWMAMIDQGAGATMEAWNPTDKPNLTYSHPWSSSPASDIPQYLFGINPTSPGYDTFTVKPQSDPSVPWAHITVPTPKGSVGAAYDLVAGHTDVGTYVPPNSTATVYVRGGDPNARSVYVDGVRTPAVYDNGYLRVDHVTPGCHVLTTNATGRAYRDSHLTAVCPGTYRPHGGG